MSAPVAPPAPDDTPTRVAQARDLGQQIRAETVGVITAVQDLVRELPAVIADPIVDALQLARGQVEDMLAELQRWLDQPGQPFDLRTCGFVWANDIQNTLTGIASAMAAGELEATTSWKGVGADAYRAALLPQKEALNGLAAAGPEINTACNDLADAIKIFWIAVLGALVALLAALVGVRRATNPFVFGGVVIAVAAAATAISLAIGNLVNKANSSTATLNNRAGNNAGLPDGRWPTAASKVSGDGSITDGDGSDWRLRD